MNNPFFIHNPHFIERSSRIFVAIVVAFLVSVSPVYATDISSQSIISLTNTSRIERGISPLVQSQALTHVAQNKANDMVKNNYFDHYSPAGLTPWSFMLAHGYNYSLAGENLAMDFATAEGVNNAWLASPSHARNELNPDFLDIGVAVVRGTINGSDTTLVVQMFGHKQSMFQKTVLQSSLVQTVSHILGINS